MVTMPQRVAQEEIPKNKRWNLAGAWEVEYDRLAKWLKNIAGINYGQLGEPRAATEAGKSLSDQIYAAFRVEFPAIDPTLMIAAGRGELQARAPKEFAITALSLLKWIAFFAEIALFLVLIIMGEADTPILLMGIILAASGWALGRGLGGFMISLESGKGFRSFADWILCILGVGGCLLVAWVRIAAIISLGDVEGGMGIAGVIGIPVALYALIAVFEALELTQKYRYKMTWDQMFMVQQWYAVDQHSKAYETGLWASIYESSLRSIAKDFAEVKGQGVTGHAEIRRV